mmetsp:Transcript_32473/g.74207  ORF Transcript_32473/g.74207 Transcript_32473/m.74207 type:complete len:164 (+) Transcript_32473:46-537(+)
MRIGFIAILAGLKLMGAEAASSSRVCRTTIAAGGRCSRDSQCARHGWCSEAGQCERPLELGSPCLRDAQCHQGSCTGDVCRKLYFDGRQCLRDSQCLSRYCAAGICTRPARSGTCTRDNECRGGYCHTTGGVCRKCVSNGRNCERDAQCRTSAYCGSTELDEL